MYLEICRQDQATATGKMYRKFGMWFLKYASRDQQTDKLTQRHTDHNTGGKVKIYTISK